MDEIDALADARRNLLSLLRRQGIEDLDVLGAMQSVPRERFVAPELRDEAYENRPLPIGFDQTISQPYIIAKMTETLKVAPGCRVLEVGTGSGYQTAVLAKLAKEVFTIERIAELSEGAQRALAELGFVNVHFRVGDGSLGWPEEAPFDRILVTAAAPRTPPSLADQLAEGGRLVVPVQMDSGRGQGLYVFVKTQGELTPLYLGGCRFVPLIGREGYAEDDW
jgi:protein-L-isoaspartate(D-aspartate) O-methyltransferase